MVENKNSANCSYSLCGKIFDIVWGGPGVFGNRRKYCCLGHRLKAEKEKARAREKARRWDIDKKLIRHHRVRGRACKWEHCQVDDEHHIESWNAPLDVCPSCYRQAQRVGSCRGCEGPLYKSLRRHNSLYCPTCKPLTPNSGEVSITLVCSVTGRERNIVRSATWKLPDGTSLQSKAKFGFAVIDLAPKVWAKFRV